MSASRDKNQKFTFVYSNLYQIYRKGTEAASSAVLPAEASANAPAIGPVIGPVIANDESAPIAVTPSGLTSALQAQAQAQAQAKPQSHRVLKAANVKVENYEPVEFVAKRIAARPASVAHVARTGMPATPSRVAPHETLESLKDNLKSLNDLHSRLKFMLQELEELVKKS